MGILLNTFFLFILASSFIYIFYLTYFTDANES